MIIRVSSKTNCSSAAGAISQQMRDEGTVNIQIVGAGALNQAVKAIIISRGHLAPQGFDLICRMSFVNLIIDEKERTGIRITVENGNLGIQMEAEIEEKVSKKKEPKKEKKE